MLGDRERQYSFEESSDSRAQALRLNKLLQESSSGSLELPRASALIARMYKDVQAELEAAAAVKTRGLGGKFKGWLRALPLDVAAVISMRECIKMCTSSTHNTHVHVQDLASAVGKLMELEVRILQAEAVNPRYMQRIQDQLKENCTTSIDHIRKLYNVAIDRVFQGEIEFGLTKADMMHIGKFGVDACLNAGLIQLTRGTNSHGMTVEYSLTPEIHEFLTSYTENDVRSVVSKEDMRMLCVPEPWTNLNDGGYLTLRRKSVAPLMGIRGIRKAERPRLAEAFTAEKMPEVFDAGNFMQGTAFAVHIPTRDAIQRIWMEGGGILGVPQKHPPKRPEMPLGPDWVKEGATEEDLAVFQKWKRSAVVFHKSLREWKSKTREIAGFLRSSSDDSVPLWFPMYFDKRGRWYYRGTPNPQGSDLAKSVLHFHEKKLLGSQGLFWLKVHIANSYGYDKERFEDRARWTEQHWEAIQNALDAPEDHADVWGTDAPWCMYAAAFELRNALALRNPAEYECGIPIHMDATCSGLQHFSAMLRDPIGGQYVNLTDPAQCGPKQDIYARVALNAMAVINKDMEDSDPNIAEVATWWSNTGIPRGLAKHPVMTYVYGATLKGTAEHIEQYVENEMKLSFPGDFQSFKYSMYAARKLFQGIAATVPKAEEAMRWLRSITKQQPNGKRMEWKTPTGFLVQHDYQDYLDTRIKIKSCGVSIVTVRDYTEDTKSHAMQNAISPNFVHALDAAHLTFTAHEMRKRGYSVVAIHDSFGTHPSDVTGMHECIRESFVKLYSGRNVLAEFLWDVDGIGEVPERGTLNITDVLQSEFFFC